MQFGVKTNPQHTTWEALLAMWERADANEAITSAWVFDHFYPIFSDSIGPCMEGWTTLSALAHHTQRIQVGTMVNGMPYRHPAVTANMAASLDIISGGRFQLGLGAGWNEEESSAYGISLGETLTERFDLFDESVQIILSMLENEWTDFDGKYFTITRARNEPKGPQRPHPPIVIGGVGEKRTMLAAAKWADHWNSAMADAETLAKKVEVLDRHCENVGRDRSEILISSMFRFDPELGVADARAEIEAKRNAGAQKVIANMPTPHNPDHVDRFAEIVEPFLAD